MNRLERRYTIKNDVLFLYDVGTILMSFLIF